MCSLLGSSVHEIMHGKNTGVVAIPFCSGSSRPRDHTQISCIAGRFFTHWATRVSHLLLHTLYFKYTYFWSCNLLIPNDTFPPWLLGRKSMTNLDSILKSRDIILPTKVHLIKAMAFPVVVYGCESWTLKKAECQRIDAFELWCKRRLLRVPWTARRSN